MTIHDSFQIALEHHRAGRLPQAEAVCRQILQVEPNHPAVLHFLGVMAIQTGKYEIASDLIRKAVSLKPDYVEAHFNLAIALREQGKMEEAIASYRQAIAFAPANADAHYNLGIAFHELGRLDEAVACYRQAIAHRPEFVPVYSNLGVALQDQGRLDEAVASFHAALSRAPANVEAHYNLGNAFKEQGKLNDAIECYRRALALSPDFAEAFDNLGVALHEIGRLDEAVTSYRQALALRPDWAETLGNLGMALEEQGKWDEALAMCQQALSIRETAEIRTAFVQCVKSVPAIRDTALIRRLLIRAMSEPWARPGDLVATALSLIKLNRDIGECIDRATKAWPGRLDAHELLGASGLAMAAGDQLLQCMLENAPVNDLGLERFLTMFRQVMLDAAIADEKSDGTVDIASAAAKDGVLPLYSAIARQCFNNEYVFAPADEEHAKAMVLRGQLIAAIATGAQISALQLVALAACLPLTNLPGIETLLNRTWPDAVTAVLNQQVREPLEERGYRAHIPALTPVEGDVSLLVQNQYEENPYPRWIKCAPAGKAMSFDAALRRQFPHVAFRPLGKFDNVEILVAGCGSGQHAIDSAQQYRQARILAVDLSLSSICYATRKTREIGLGNIEYAQADIMRMGSLGRVFDVIESVGVLHHLAEPLAGWRILLSLLRPGGFMRLGLYSEVAREAVVAARKFIAERGYGASAQDIRRCRQDLIASQGGAQFRQIISFRDFFATSECRDLLFHVQEHRFTLPELKRCLAELEVDFLGFSLEPRIIKQYAERFPGDPAKTDLDCWNVFETGNRDTFASMYQFWIQKRG